MTHRITLVVCTLHRPTSVRRLLEALEGQRRRPDEVLVVDASDDRSTEAVVADRAPTWGGTLHHIAVAPEQRGLTRQRNLGVARAEGTLIAFLDDDTLPDPGYLAEVEACFGRHPEAAGVGGAIEDGSWQPFTDPETVPRGWYRAGGWARPEGQRWRLRRSLGLDAGLPPGWMPASGHGRPVSFLPPDSGDHIVEMLMGGVSTWRREVLDHHHFDPGFAGYGLYEDLDLCLRAAADGPLVLATAAQVRHEHAPEARPHPARYGRMVVQNGWYVWRRRWPHPGASDRFRWWATTTVLAAARATGRPDGLREAWGRCCGMAAVLPCEVSARAVRRRFGHHTGVDGLLPQDVPRG
jgi:GT2 family glycosyltransferase